MFRRSRPRSGEGSFHSVRGLSVMIAGDGRLVSGDIFDCGVDVVGEGEVAGIF